MKTNAIIPRRGEPTTLVHEWNQMMLALGREPRARISQNAKKRN